MKEKMLTRDQGRMLWGMPLRVQLCCLVVATLLLLGRTWSVWKPVSAIQASTIIGSNPLDAVTTDVSNSPRTPRSLVSNLYKHLNYGKDKKKRLESEDLQDAQALNRQARMLIATSTSEKPGDRQKDQRDVEAKESLLKEADEAKETSDERIASWRERMNKKLYSIKKAISKAKPADADSSLNADVYHNVAAFTKSYELMERVFRIYMYKEGKKPFVHDGPLVGIYASEGQFIKHMQIRNNRFVVRNPWRAQMFFMPYSVKNMETHLYVPESQSMLPITGFINNYVEGIKSRHPFWNSSDGADHFFVSCHDWGPQSTRNHFELHNSAVKVVCNADADSEDYSVERDVSLPEINLHYLVVPTHIGGPGPDERPILAFFAGQMHGRVRPVLLQHWEKDPDMKIYEVFEGNWTKKPNYIQNMRSSKYCICAMGYEVNSPRIIEAIYQDCVPVIIADHIVLPFNDVLDWEKFSVSLPESEVPNMKSILKSIPDKDYRSMQHRLKTIRHHFLWNEGLVKYDVFHMILHSVWTTRLRQVDDQKALAANI